MNMTAKITINPEYEIGTVDKRVYGAFLEPIKNFVVGNIWNPNHETADDLGFRTDVENAVREFNMSAVRLPGGNFMSGWEWKDSIGPKSGRKAHLDLAWKQFETNDVGHDEYLQWAERSGVEALYTLNLGTQDVLSALHCVEYTNFDGGTYWSDLRRKNGREKPYNVKTWYLGNEMDGPWQIGSWEKDPKGYGVRVNETAKVIKMMDPTLETIAAGTSAPTNYTYPDWDLEVLSECYQSVDYLSLHYYHSAPLGNIKALMNCANAMEEFLLTEIGACDVIKAKMRETKPMMISFDEYACMMTPKEEFLYGVGNHPPMTLYGEFNDERSKTPFAHIDPENSHNQFAGTNGMLEALGTTDMLMTFVRHSDRVKIACMTTALMNAISPTKDGVHKTPLYYPYYDMNKYGRGTAINSAVTCPTFDTEGYAINVVNQKRAYKNIPTINTVTVLSEDKKSAAIFIINRSDEDDLDISVDVKAFENFGLLEHEEMYCSDVFNNEETVLPKKNNRTVMENGIVKLTAKKLSFNMIRIGK